MTVFHETRNKKENKKAISRKFKEVISFHRSPHDDLKFQLKKVTFAKIMQRSKLSWTV